MKLKHNTIFFFNLFKFLELYENPREHLRIVPGSPGIL